MTPEVAVLGVVVVMLGLSVWALSCRVERLERAKADTDGAVLAVAEHVGLLKGRADRLESRLGLAEPCARRLDPANETND